ARHPQWVDLERRPDAQDLHRGRAARIAPGQELSRGIYRPRSAGTCLRRMDVPDAARRSCRSGGRIPPDDNRFQHCGGPLAIGPYAGKREEAFTEWRNGIRKIAALPNTYVKLGGLGMKMIGFTFYENPESPSSQDLEKPGALISRPASKPSARSAR